VEVVIRHRCPVCTGLLTHSAATAGATVACHHCRSLIEVPRGSTAAAEAAGIDRPSGPAAGPSGGIVDRIGRWMGAHTSDDAPGALTAGRRAVWGVMGLFLLALFGGVGAHGASSFVERSASERWAKAEGVVEDAGVYKKVGRTALRRRTVEHSAAVHYKYTVKGKEHEGGRIAFGPSENYSFLARAQAGQYRPGQKVTVYYDPARPESAVLQREVQLGGYLFTVVGLFVGYVGLRLLLLALAPTTASSNSRWLPWSRRFTRVDVPLTAAGAVALALWLPMLLGL
jgi:hypothetical protein